MKSMIEYLVKELVDDPETVVVTSTEDEFEIRIKVEVDKRYLGQVIGKQGRIANAMRVILVACGRKAGERRVLKLDITEASPAADQQD